MFKVLKSRRFSDRGDSIVSFIFIMPIFFSFLVTMIDTSVYFANRSIIHQVASDGARTVAIYGGGGNSSIQSPLEAAYGGNNGVCADSRAVNGNAIECNVLDRLEKGAGLTNVPADELRVDCGPWIVTSAPERTAWPGLIPVGGVGSTTYCDIQWTYNGIPGSVTSFIGGVANGNPLQDNSTRGTSESEVNMEDVPFVPRTGTWTSG